MRQILLDKNVHVARILHGVGRKLAGLRRLPVAQRTQALQGGNDALDSDIDPTTGKTINTTLSAGETDLTWDAGLYQKAALGDKVWLDTNKNGVQDAGEAGVSGVTVKLLDSAGRIERFQKRYQLKPGAVSTEGNKTPKNDKEPRPAAPERAEKQARPEKSDKSDKGDKADKGDKPQGKAPEAKPEVKAESKGEQKPKGEPKGKPEGKPEAKKADRPPKAAK